MGRNRSLDDFAAGGDDRDGGRDAPAGDDHRDGGRDAPAGDDESAPDTDADANDTVDAAAVDPATVTYDWSPDGAPCDRCGETVERRWLDDGERVCEACKEW